MDKLVHFEIPVDDMARAKDFYGSLFGWQLSDWQMPDGSVYVGARTVEVDDKQTPKEPGAINGGMVARSAEVPAPVFAVHVKSIDETLQKIQAKGGTLVRPKTDIMGMGFYAYVKDSEGNVLGLWEDAPKG